MRRVFVVAACVIATLVGSVDTRADGGTYDPEEHSWTNQGSGNGHAEASTLATSAGRFVLETSASDDPASAVLLAQPARANSQADFAAPAVPLAAGRYTVTVEVSQLSVGASTEFGDTVLGFLSGAVSCACQLAAVARETTDLTAYDGALVAGVGGAAVNRTGRASATLTFDLLEDASITPRAMLGGEASSGPIPTAELAGAGSAQLTISGNVASITVEAAD